MKIVIISYVCFPNICPRSWRATELAKEFARNGHEVVLYAVLGKYNYSKFKDETHVNIKNLGKLFLTTETSDGRGEKLNLGGRIINYCFGKLFWLPERELVPKVKDAIKKEGNIDCLITIAFPHIIHYATSLSDLQHVHTWIADCGDPFTLNPMTHFPPYYKKYEERWCEKCDFITVPIEDARNGYYPQYRSKIKVIPQGFDFSKNKICEYSKNKILTFAYAGITYKGTRDPTAFLKYLNSCSYDFRFFVYGRFSIFEDYKNILGNKLIYKGNIPREQLITELSQMDFLINIKNTSGVQQPSKLIDYKISNRPILTISSNFDNEEKQIFCEFLHGNYEHQQIVNNIEQYNIINVANEFLKLVK